jgi:hypothetical protein
MQLLLPYITFRFPLERCRMGYFENVLIVLSGSGDKSLLFLLSAKLLFVNTGNEVPGSCWRLKTLMYCSYLKLTITVLQYLLGRPVRFHDLAFFDPVIYESLRQLVLDSERQGADNAFALQVFFMYGTRHGRERGVGPVVYMVRYVP